MTPEEILGLDSEQAENVAAVKRAYALRLKQCRPDRDPEGFRRLRDAYEVLIERLQSGRRVDVGAATSAWEQEESDAINEPVPLGVESDVYARAAEAYARDRLGEDALPLATVARELLADVRLAPGDPHWCMRLAMQLALREPELALCLSQRVSLRMQMESESVSMRLELARQMCHVLSAQRLPVARLIDDQESAEQLSAEEIETCHYVCYVLPAGFLKDVVYSRLCEREPERSDHNTSNSPVPMEERAYVGLHHLLSQIERWWSAMPRVGYWILTFSAILVLGGVLWLCALDDIRRGIGWQPRPFPQRFGEGAAPPIPYVPPPVHSTLADPARVLAPDEGITVRSTFPKIGTDQVSSPQPLPSAEVSDVPKPVLSPVLRPVLRAVPLLEVVPSEQKDGQDQPPPSEASVPLKVNQVEETFEGERIW